MRGSRTGLFSPAVRLSVRDEVERGQHREAKIWPCHPTAQSRTRVSGQYRDGLLVFEIS